MRRAFLMMGVACVWLACGEGFGSGDTGTATSGGNTPCMVASDCSAAPTPCSRPECADGTCRYTSVEAGELPLDLQVQGDCRELVCDGNGAVVDEKSNGDAPSGRECTQGQCNDGTPVEVPVSPGTPCGQNMQLACNDQGMCAGCMSPADCGQPPVCQMHKCSSGVCSAEPVPAGTAPEGLQTEGDCKSKVCNGRGMAVDQADGTDPPVGDECVQGHCEDANPVLQNLVNGTLCGSTLAEVCCSGTCCQPLEVCSSNTCTGS